MYQQTTRCANCGGSNNAAAAWCTSCGMQLPDTFGRLVIVPTPPIYNQVAFRCPYCGSQAGSRIVNKISTGGIVMIIALLLICFPIFWIGFFMTEPSYFCRTCNMKLA